jgi:hypothetical protein
VGGVRATVRRNQLEVPVSRLSSAQARLAGRLSAAGGDAGMTTAEYAVGTVVRLCHY